MPVSRSAPFSVGLPDTAPPGWLGLVRAKRSDTGHRKLPAELVACDRGHGAAQTASVRCGHSSAQ